MNDFVIYWLYSNNRVNTKLERKAKRKNIGGLLREEMPQELPVKTVLFGQKRSS